jgi:L-fuconate dehydratase
VRQHCIAANSFPPAYFVCSLIDYIAVSGSMDRNVLEFVDHLHEHFVTPCTINSRGKYNVPLNPNEGYRFDILALFVSCNLLTYSNVFFVCLDSIEMHKSSIAEYEWPNGSYWVGVRDGRL